MTKSFLFFCFKQFFLFICQDTKSILFSLCSLCYFCVFPCVLVSVQLEARGQSQLLFLGHSPPWFFETGSLSHRPGAFLIGQNGLGNEPQGPTCVHLPSAWVTSSGPHVCLSALPTEPSFSPLHCILNCVISTLVEWIIFIYQDGHLHLSSRL